MSSRQSFDGYSRGFTLIELIVSIAIVGTLAVVVIPAYKDYIETTNMVRFDSAYNHAVRAAQQEFTKDATKITLGLNSKVPDDPAVWISIINTVTENYAPGSGPSYVTDKQSKKVGSDKVIQFEPSTNPGKKKFSFNY